MGLLDTVIGSVLGGNSSSPMGSILGQILGGSTGQGSVGGVQGGGLGGLLEQLRNAGLGPQIDSWIGSGQNQSVSPDQLHQAFGRDQVSTWANQAGMQPHDFLSQLSQHLPRAVDQITPGGRLPDEGTVSV